MPERILIVDDDPLVCRFMQHVLEDSGYHVWTAHCGGDALDVLAKHGHELGLLVTDVVMPGMSWACSQKCARRALPYR